MPPFQQIRLHFKERSFHRNDLWNSKASFAKQNFLTNLSSTSSSSQQQCVLYIAFISSELCYSQCHSTTRDNITVNSLLMSIFSFWYPCFYYSTVIDIKTKFLYNKLLLVGKLRIRCQGKFEGT